MVHIHHRSELIEYARDRVSSYACERAFTTGKVCVLGGFSSIPPRTTPGWILSVTSRHRKTWLVAITSNEHLHNYDVWFINKAPWEFWDGKIDREGYSIYDGDRPMTGLCLKIRATI